MGAAPPAGLMAQATAAIPSLGEVVGIGVDLVALPRFETFLQRHGDELEEVFTPRELAAPGAPRGLYLATRWALKEAALKAVGTGWGPGLAWTEVEATGRTFAPRLLVHGEVAKRLAARGQMMLIGSVSCAGSCVIAVAVLARGAAAQERP